MLKEYLAYSNSSKNSTLTKDAKQRFKSKDKSCEKGSDGLGTRSTSSEQTASTLNALKKSRNAIEKSMNRPVLWDLRAQVN
jgi:hypothetical protein